MDILLLGATLIPVSIMPPQGFPQTKNTIFKCHFLKKLTSHNPTILCSNPLPIIGPLASMPPDIPFFFGPSCFEVLGI